MQALRWHGRRDVRLEEVAEPPPGPHADALIAVTHCGICGTDLSEWRDGPGLIRTSPHPLTEQEPPVTLGHELVGTLLEGESPDGTVQSGARVTVDACVRCGRCPACARGDYHLCRYGGSIGLHMDGGLAPLVRVPSYTLIPVPDEVDDRQAALTEPFAVGLHGLDRAGARPGTEILVLGFGTIGAASALVARSLGIVAHVVERDEERRGIAERLGFATLDSGDDLPRRVRKALGGGPEVVIESTGVAALVPVAVECAARGGRIALLGLPASDTPLDPRRLTLFERSLVGSLGYRNDLPRVLELVAAGLLDPAEVIGATVPLGDAAAAIEELATEPDARIKVLVETAGP